MANPINLNGLNFQQAEYIPVNFATDYSGQGGGTGGLLEKLKLENDYLRNENELWKSKVRELEKKVQDQVLELKRKDVELKNKDLEMKAKQLDAYKRAANQNAFPNYDGQYNQDPSFAGCSKVEVGQPAQPPVRLTKKGKFWSFSCVFGKLTIYILESGTPYKRGSSAAPQHPVNASGNEFVCAVCNDAFRTPAELRLHDIITHARKRVHNSMKRDWMTKNIRKKGAMDKDYYNTFINCKGSY